MSSAAVVIGTLRVKVSPPYSCNTGNETATPDFFDISRLTFFRRTKHYHPFSRNTLLFGKHNLNNLYNEAVLEVLSYIEKTRLLDNMIPFSDVCLNKKK